MDSSNSVLLCYSLGSLDDMEEKYQQAKNELDQMVEEMSNMS